MFGIIRPCRNRLDDELRAAWMAHLCGMCLALRDEHGHLARLVTNYDAVLVSALVEAQTGTDGRRRHAGPCALRGLRTASVADGSGARLAASASLLLASATLTDHVDDGDLEGALRTRATRAVARRWARAGTDTGSSLAFDTAGVLAAVAEQRDLETTPGSLLDVTRPAETAAGLAFGHTAVLADRPGNQVALTEAGRLFGRLAHLLDAVEDVHADRASGAWNPILALGLGPAEVRRRCDDAVLGITLAMRDADFADDRLVRALLVHEPRTSVERVFAAVGHGTRATQPLTPPLPPDQQPPDQPPDLGWGAPPTGVTAPDRSAGFWGGCLGWLVLCGTCQVCCRSQWENPCNGKRHEGICRDGGDCCPCDCDDSNCDCCDCCECGDCCDCSC